MATKLVYLPESQRLSSRVIRVLGGNPGKFTLQGTNTYLIGTGRQRILIDTGEGRPSWAKAIQELLLKENAECLAILTHWHGDHVGGVNDLQKMYPGIKIFKCQPSPMQHNIRENQVFEVEGATLRAVFTPGHTSDHMSLVLEEEDAMFTGDNVLGHGTAVFEDLSVYISSLRKMKDLFSGRAYPGHGPVIEDGKARIIEYIRHRQDREDQVVKVLKTSTNETTGSSESKEWGSMEVVKIIYRDVPENLHLAAHGGIMQILRKLMHEGIVVENPLTMRWRLGDRAAL